MKLSIVTTVYKSENYLYEFHTRTLASIKQLQEANEVSSYEMIYVNDGSPDQSLEILKTIIHSESNAIVVDFSRNFGHHQAIMAGLQQATGDFVFLIDCDLEESPELLVDFWQAFQKEPDLDVVYGIQTKRKGNAFERLSGRVFYWFINQLIDFEYPKDTLTARLMKQAYVKAIALHTEKAIEIWSLFIFSGFRQKAIPATKGYKGTTSYLLSKKIRMAIETITSTSSKPLYLIFVSGFVISFVALLFLIRIVFVAYYFDTVIEGWASTVASVWLVGGFISIFLGVIAIYLSKVFQETKNRPLYIVKNIIKQTNDDFMDRI
jgi:putative glycosyltransferase